jgi:endogenous inhibitor of DNA gyrase (YacG/DUF329 family)
MTAEPVKTEKCPICGKPAEPAYRPFCSKRCADVDLQRWLRGAYAVPAVENEDGPAGADGEGGEEP